jgi:hypothetical protein
MTTRNKERPTGDPALQKFLVGKSGRALLLFDHFIKEFTKIGPVTVHPAKTMIGIATPQKRIAHVTQFGKDFIHVVFPFNEPYPDNLCFQKIAQVPGDQKQFNHHFRMLAPKDVNAEVKKFMKLAFASGK